MFHIHYCMPYLVARSTDIDSFRDICGLDCRQRRLKELLGRSARRFENCHHRSSCLDNLSRKLPYSRHHRELGSRGILLRIAMLSCQHMNLEDIEPHIFLKHFMRRSFQGSSSHKKWLSCRQMCPNKCSSTHIVSCCFIQKSYWDI